MTLDVSNRFALAPPARTIAPPPRADAREAAVLLALVAGFAASTFLPAHSAVRPAAAVALFALAAVAWTRQRWTLTHVALFGGLWFAARALPLPMWPGGLGLAVAGYAVIAARVPALRASVAWLRRGRGDRTTALLAAAFVALPAVALVLWHALFRPDLAPYRGYIPAGFPFWMLAVGALGFAAVNAVMEEVMWRGLVMEATDAALGAGWRSVAVQAAAFGVWHFYGFPSGLVGAVLAAIFAGMMGTLRRYSRGMLVPVAAHAAADWVIALILIHAVGARA